MSNDISYRQQGTEDQSEMIKKRLKEVSGQWFRHLSREYKIGIHRKSRLDEFIGDRVTALAQALTTQSTMSTLYTQADVTILAQAAMGLQMEKIVLMVQALSAGPQQLHVSSTWQFQVSSPENISMSQLQPDDCPNIHIGQTQVSDLLSNLRG